MMGGWSTRSIEEDSVKLKAAARTSLSNETRSSIGSFGEVPNCRQRNQGSKKADYKNVQRVGVGVLHNILHHHEENVGALSDFLCGISHITNRVRRNGNAA
jgi:hypothetical protein